MSTLHVHADEAGDLNFKAGSRFYIFGVVWTHDPAPLAATLQRQRYVWCRDGHDIARFHAQSDKAYQRQRVYDLMLADPSWTFSALVVDMSRVFPALQAPEKFYPRFLGHALEFPLRGRTTWASRVLVYTDRLPQMRAKKQGVEKAIKMTCAKELRPRQIPWHVFHHPSESNAWLQVADYCCWALQRKHEHGQDDFYRLVSPRLAAPELVLWP